MGKRKTDKAKLLEGYGSGHGKDYKPYIRANEGHRFGTSTQLYDPIADRTVDVLSIGEYDLFWQLRYDPDVIEIREQFPLLDQELIEFICEKEGFDAAKHTKSIMTTDFLVDYRNGDRVAYSCKKTRKEYAFKKETRTMNRTEKKLLVRQYIECLYWEQNGVDFHTVITSELNRTFSENIAHIMQFYPVNRITSGETLYKYLVAHHSIGIDLESYLFRLPNDIEKYDAIFARMIGKEKIYA